jgi:serine/threonine protein kinase
VRAAARFCPRCGYLLLKQLAPGAELAHGDYQIVRSISKGGMGAVYLAQDRRAFDRPCVVKQMLDYYDPGNPEDRRRAQQRFEEEGRTLATLTHPGIPRIYAFIQEFGRYYIVMEYIEGDNLASFTSREGDNGLIPPSRRLHQEEVIRYVIQVCRILEYLHGRPRPVVHQDVKPANLILESLSGDVRLVDFGTARSRGHTEGDPGEADEEGVYGTAGYAPPEQYRGKVVPRSDVFALAATAYHVLTDDDPEAHPFQWPHLERLPRELGLALQRALRNKPEDRSTARELRQALEAMSTPQRTLEVFTFPGNAQIRTVGALPALADEHWDAARSFLYQGDFQRWLRDINRHDLVVTADQIVAREENRDLGLERFLQAVDPGLPDPKIAADPPEIDLGSVARVSALSRRVALRNQSRGYASGTVATTEPWLEVHPTRVHLWAGIPTYVSVNVRAEDLPFRSQQEGTVAISIGEGGPAVEIRVRARVSLMREAARILWRAVSAAAPESWRRVHHTWAFHVRLFRRVERPIARHPWLFWLAWLLLSGGLGAAMYYMAARLAGLPVIGVLLHAPNGIPEIVPRAILGPPLVIGALWPSIVILSLLVAALVGAAVGAWRSFRA